MTDMDLRRFARRVIIGLGIVFFVLFAAVFSHIERANAGAPCSGGRASLQSIAEAVAAESQEPSAGRLWNRLDRAAAGSEVFYVVFEKRTAAGVFVFRNGCLIASEQRLDADALLRALGTTHADAFPDGGI